MTTFRLYYWPSIQGRGEFVRLVLLDAGADWVDVARLPESKGGGVPAVVQARRGGLGGVRPYVPPILVDGDQVVAQMPLVCAHVASRCGLVPDDPDVQRVALQHALSIADVVGEVHAAHHPISTARYYEDQRDEAIRAAEAFRETRLPSWLGYFEAVLRDAGGEGLIGEHSYVDVLLMQLVKGLRAMFPVAMAREEQEVPRVVALHDRVASRPHLAAWLASPDRLPFSEQGIFRPYPELDG